MAVTHLLDYRIEAQGTRSQQYEQVVEQVGAFTQERIIRLAQCRERDFQSLLTDLLCDAPHALFVQACRVAAIWLIGDALSDDLLELQQEAQALPIGDRVVAKAGRRSGMA